MAKRVLILSSSPRRGGNSDTLCDEFMRGTVEAGNEAEKIFLGDKTVHYCTGCSVCSLHKKALSAERRCSRDYWENVDSRRDCHGHPGLFLYHERSDENADRPLLRTLYGDEQQGILFYRYCGRRRYPLAGTYRRHLSGISRLSEKTSRQRGSIGYGGVACRGNKR